MDALKLKYWVSKRGFSQQEIAKKLKIDYSTWSRKCKGSSDFNRSEIQMLKTILNLPTDEMELIFFKE